MFFFWFLLIFTVVSSCEASSSYLDPHCSGRQVIVHLFEWKWKDVAAECERYLGPKGFCGVQISPPNENVIVTSGASRPWWERYQPVSYKLDTRSGDETEFQDMVNRCKAVGVRIYVDAVLNHMAGSDRSGKGTGGSSYNGYNKDFPGVSYSYKNFHTSSDCGSSGGINYQVSRQVRNCDLVGLRDLDHSQSYVQDKVVEYLSSLVNMGVAGFRVDASKHMWPNDLLAMQNKVVDLPEGGRPFFYHEVIDPGSEAVKDDEYFRNGYVTEFRYHQKVKEGVNSFSRLHYVYDSGWSMVPSNQALVFVDNHDTQRQSGTLTYKSGSQYKRALAFTLANNYGFVRVMSSYEFRSSNDGPPHESNYDIKDVTIKSDGSCGNGWVCEHRWNMVGNLARFRNYVAGESVTKWSTSSNVLSFSRGRKGFFAMGSSTFSTTRDTGLPAGEYCDLVSDCAIKITVDSKGKALVKPAVSSEPFVAITTEEGFTPTDEVNSNSNNKNNSNSNTNNYSNNNNSNNNKNDKNTSNDKNNNKSNEDTDNNTDKNDKNSNSSDDKNDKNNNNGKNKNNDKSKENEADGEDFQRTVIIMDKTTSYGESVFIRGGVDSSLRSGCGNNAARSNCSIPIKHGNSYTGSHYDTLNAWKKGDNYLDWIGGEPGQGTYKGKRAQGTPGFWSTNKRGKDGYNSLNKWGDHYWIFDFEMDCSKSENGYFQVRANVNGLVESRLRSLGACDGDGAPAESPFDSIYHIGRCGYLNVFHYAKGTCEISTL